MKEVKYQMMKIKNYLNMKNEWMIFLKEKLLKIILILIKH